MKEAAGGVDPGPNEAILEVCPSWYREEPDLQSTTVQHLASIRTLSIVGNTLVN